MIQSNKQTVQTRDIVIGAADAPVTILCYIDYESVQCANLNGVLNQLLANFPTQLKISFRHFPLAGKHQKAMKAAEAVVAAAQEDMFWPMHNLLFNNQKKLGTISLKQYAKELGSTNKRFLDQLINGDYAWQVREDLLEGVAAGVKTAPTVFINSQLYNEDLDYNSLETLINDSLSLK